MNEVICTKGNELTIDHLYTIEGYATIFIKVRSGEFSGASNFCIQIDNILLIVNDLAEMYKVLDGRCEIKDSDSDSFITSEVDKYGHVCIYGQIGGTHEEHLMKFKVDTDQTVLKKLIDFFKEIM